MEDPEVWILSDADVRDFTDSQNTDDSDRPWAPWGRLTGISSAYNRDVAHAVANRVLQVPSMGLLPGRLYNPTKGSFPICPPEGACSYDQHPYDQRPDYVVISYTWGRWIFKTREDDTFISGANWLAPANSLFTRSDLDFAVRKIAGGSDVWLDVFCIPQNDDDPEKAIEIGKQGSIFRSASRAVVWLGTGGESILVEVCSWVPEIVEMVTEHFLKLPNTWTLRSQGRPEKRDPEPWRRIKIVAEFTKHVPWASSLWTLQEAALRPDAVFHGKLGEPLLSQRTGIPITIKHLRTAMRHIRQELLNFIEEMHKWDNLSPSEMSDLWGPSEKDGWYLDNNDISLVFQALDTVNTVSLHNLGTMNAGELLLSSKQRTASTAHDRVYGIMGAIGVTLPVNYRSDPDRALDDFLLQLHNQVPAEIQAFYRPAMFRPSQKQWMIDEDSKMLTLLRQKEIPETPTFVEITPEGWLVAAQIEPLAAGGLAHLTGRILSNRARIAADMAAFRTLSTGIQNKTQVEGRALPAHISHILRMLSSKTQLALVYLGTVSGIEQRGWRTAYMLLARLSHEGEIGDPFTVVNNSQHFQRLGIVIAMEKFSFNKVARGRFIIR